MFKLKTRLFFLLICCSLVSACQPDPGETSPAKAQPETISQPVKKKAHSTLRKMTTEEIISRFPGMKKAENNFVILHEDASSLSLTVYPLVHTAYYFETKQAIDFYTLTIPLYAFAFLPIQSIDMEIIPKAYDEVNGVSDASELANVMNHSIRINITREQALSVLKKYARSANDEPVFQNFSELTWQNPEIIEFTPHAQKILFRAQVAENITQSFLATQIAQINRTTEADKNALNVNSSPSD